MAEYNCNNIFECLENFEEYVEKCKVDIQKEFFSKIRPLLSEYKREEHSEEENKKFIDLMDKLVKSLRDTDTVVKDIISASMEEKCAALETTCGIRQSMIRPKPTRENRESGREDSGYVGSTDSRVLTEEFGHLVTATQPSDNEDSDGVIKLGNTEDSDC